MVAMSQSTTRDAEFRLRCECGKEHAVPAGAAGSRLDCPCGRKVEVPSLGELRRQSGLPAYQPKAALVIPHMLADKELPTRTHCANCERETDEVAMAGIECERIWRKASDDGPDKLLSVLVFGGWALLFRRQDNRVFGRDLIFQLPLRLCPTCRGEILPRRYPLITRLAVIGLIIASVVVAFAVSPWGLLLAIPAIVIWIADQWSQVRRTETLKRLLSREPIYAQLLDDYPDAIVSI
jgi:hypothetical protein